MHFKDAIYRTLAVPRFQSLYTRLLGYLLRLKGFNNYPHGGGDLGIGGEEWILRRILGRDVCVCLDVGANKGEYTLNILRLSSATVYAIEPIPPLAKRVSDSTQEFGARCIVAQCAIADYQGQTTLRYSSTQTEAASLDPAVSAEVYQYDSEVNVPVTTIDAFVAEREIKRVDFIKLDVEGLERACLAGAVETIRNMQPKFVQVEMNWQHIFTGTTLYALSQFLPGYNVYRLLPQGLCRVDPRSTIDNLYAYSNYIFSRLPLDGNTGQPASPEFVGTTH